MLVAILQLQRGIAGAAANVAQQGRASVGELPDPRVVQGDGIAIGPVETVRRVHGRFGAVLPPQDALWADTSG